MALEALASRLRTLGVPCRMKRNTPNPAPSVGNEADDRFIPSLYVSGGWRVVKVLYWSGTPYYSYPYLAGGRWPIDEAGTDRIASQVTMDYNDARARGDVDNRTM